MQLGLAHVRLGRKVPLAGTFDLLRVAPIFKALPRYIRHCLNQLSAKKVCPWARVCDCYPAAPFPPSGLSRILLCSNNNALMRSWLRGMPEGSAR